MKKNKKFQKKGSSSLNKLSLFQKSDGKFQKKCPLSLNGKIISSKITSFSFNKQKKLTKEIKKAKILGLI